MNMVVLIDYTLNISFSSQSANNPKDRQINRSSILATSITTSTKTRFPRYQTSMHKPRETAGSSYSRLKSKIPRSLDSRSRTRPRKQTFHHQASNSYLAPRRPLLSQRQQRTPGTHASGSISEPGRLMPSPNTMQRLM
jgi:hypothetical protein